MVLIARQRIDGSGFIWYMLCGAMTAWLFECCYKAVIYPRTMLKPKVNHPPTTMANTPKSLRWLLSALVYVRDDDRSSSSVHVDSGFESTLVWRFLPDVLFVVSGVIISSVGKLGADTTASVFRWVLTQIISSSFIVVSLLQRGDSRINFSRTLLETPFMNAVGKASFFIYTLQIAAFNFYTRVILDDVANKSFPIVSNNKSLYVEQMWSFNWYQRLPLGNRIAGFLCLVTICWVLQTYFQDYFVAIVAKWLFRVTTRIRNY